MLSVYGSNFKMESEPDMDISSNLEDKENVFFAVNSNIFSPEETTDRREENEIIVDVKPKSDNTLLTEDELVTGSETAVVFQDEPEVKLDVNSDLRMEDEEIVLPDAIANIETESETKPDDALKSDATDRIEPVQQSSELDTPEIKLKPVTIPKPRPAKRIFRPIYSRLRLKAKCHICNCYFKRSSLAGHLKHVHGESVLQCNFCKRSFSRPDSAKNHVILHHNIDPDNVKDHISTVKKKDLTQEEMPMIRSKMANVVPIKRILTAIKAFYCHDCDSSFTSWPELLSHCEKHRYAEDGSKFPTLIPQ